jgi:hypothetical protein
MSAKALDLVAAASREEAGTLAVALAPERDRVLYRLLVLNILLQIFDGIATYSGLHLGIREANPLLRGAFHVWGIAPTLLVFKVSACFLLILVYRIASEALARSALTLLVCVYSVCSLIPWLTMFLRVLLRFN